MRKIVRFSFDVFLSHSSKDKAVVRAIAERLRADGLRVETNMSRHGKTWGGLQPAPGFRPASAPKLFGNFQRSGRAEAGLKPAPRLAIRAHVNFHRISTRQTRVSAPHGSAERAII